MKKYHFVFQSVILFSVCIGLFLGCTNKEKTLPLEEPALKIQENDHTWYCFTQTGFKITEKPGLESQVPLLPWTEAVRISSSNSINDLNGNSKAFAIVNRLGLLTFENEKITISKDVNLFSQRTAGNLIFVNNSPFFSVYKSSFFNDSIKDPNYKNNLENHLFLIHFDDKAGISYPVINCNNISHLANSEVTDFVWDGLTFSCCVKSITDVKNEFSYLTFTPKLSLENLSPSSAENNLTVTESSFENFQEAKQHKIYSSAPQRIKSLLKGFSDSLPFTLEVKTEGGSSPRVYENAVPDSDKDELHAKALLAPSWSAALFEDGTLFIEGALNGKHILRGGKAVAIRLPKLPENFIYSDFVISGSYLYAAWEESSFYKTGRSGFLQVNLDKTLYNKLL